MAHIRSADLCQLQGGNIVSDVDTAGQTHQRSHVDHRAELKRQSQMLQQVQERVLQRLRDARHAQRQRQSQGYNDDGLLSAETCSRMWKYMKDWLKVQKEAKSALRQLKVVPSLQREAQDLHDTHQSAYRRVLAVLLSSCPKEQDMRVFLEKVSRQKEESKEVYTKWRAILPMALEHQRTLRRLEEQWDIYEKLRRLVHDVGDYMKKSHSLDVEIYESTSGSFLLHAEQGQGGDATWCEKVVALRKRMNELGVDLKADLPLFYDPNLCVKKPTFKELTALVPQVWNAHKLLYYVTEKEEEEVKKDMEVMLRTFKEVRTQVEDLLSGQRTKIRSLPSPDFSDVPAVQVGDRTLLLLNGRNGTKQEVIVYGDLPLYRDGDTEALEGLLLPEGEVVHAYPFFLYLDQQDIMSKEWEAAQRVTEVLRRMGLWVGSTSLIQSLDEDVDEVTALPKSGSTHVHEDPVLHLVTGMHQPGRPLARLLQHIKIGSLSRPSPPQLLRFCQNGIDAVFNMHRRGVLHFGLTAQTIYVHEVDWSVYFSGWLHASLTTDDARYAVTVATQVRATYRTMVTFLHKAVTSMGEPSDQPRLRPLLSTLQDFLDDKCSVEEVMTRLEGMKKRM